MRALIVLFFILIAFGFSNNSDHSGIEIYAVKSDFKSPIKDCTYCFDEKRAALSEAPILEEKDIENFNWKKQQIILTGAGKQKMAQVKIELSGLPVVMMLNGQRIYGFWFWDALSSFGCDRVYAYPKSDFKIGFGLPTNNTFGKDPRYNKSLAKYVLEKFKQE